MKLKKIILIILFLISFKLLYANPIVVFYMNELQIDSTQWKLELKNLDFWTSNLDSCFLTTSTDTAYFKPGISTFDSFLVVTKDSLLNNLIINRSGDILCLYYLDDGYPLEQIRFGNASVYNDISSPKLNQSISLREYDDGDGQAFYYYLDNTPTFGYVNDALNAKGYVTGLITDSLGNPLPDVEIVYDYFYSLGTRYDISVLTDSTGIFLFEDYARLSGIVIKKQNYKTEHRSFQIWPEDTITINDTLYFVIDAIKNNTAVSLNDFKLSQNYPNPFNNSTCFSYTIPKADFVEINIYDLAGKLVEKLFAGKQNRGEYKVHWNAESVASGIYIYQIKTNEFINHKKCLLIK